MLRQVLIAFVVAVVGCPRPTSRDPAPTADAAPAPSPDLATSAAPVASVPAPSVSPSLPPFEPPGADSDGRRPPTRSELLAPFAGSAPRGFVAWADLRPDGARVASTLPGPGNPDLDVPVLVASFTKLWTAVAALRMVARKELDLDATLKELLPGSELARRPWADSQLRELLTHTSRVPEFDDRTGYYRKADVDFANPVEALARHVPRDVTEKRGVFKYRNAEFALVGAILATKAGIPIDAVLAREVFAPAKMTHAGLLAKVADAPRELDLTPLGPVRAQNFFTAGAGYASGSDLLRFFAALAGDELLAAADKELLFAAPRERDHGASGCWAYPFAGSARMVERPGSFGNVRLFTAFYPVERRALVAWSSAPIEIRRPRAGRGLGATLGELALGRPLREEPR